MGKFIKKPVVVEAEQWFKGKDVKGVFLHQGCEYRMCPVCQGARKDEIIAYVVTAHNQNAYLSEGDWIITEPDGKHHYPCKPDIFKKTYEPV